MDSLAFEKQIVAVDGVLHSPTNARSRKEAATQLQHQTHLAISTETLLRLQGAELGVQRGGS